MKQSILVLLSRSIDYAGLFPPARLPMEEALRAYVRYLGLPERWLLARFVCPASQLDALLALGASLPAGAPPLMIAALGRGGEDAGAFSAALREDEEAIARFLQRAGGRMVVDQFEVKLPQSMALAPHSEEVASVAGAASDILGQGRTMLVALESSLAPSAPGTVREVAAGLAAANAMRQGGGSRPVCLKIRCGGLDATAIPTLDQVAEAVVSARDHGVLLKATQGLHHPFHHFDDVLGAPAHGFVNLLAAGALAREHRLDEQQVTAILGDEDPANFAFSPDGLEWRGRRVGLHEIAAGRRYGIASFGSCSFDEPLSDLRSHGLLD